MDISYNWIQEEYFKGKLPKPNDLVEKVTLQAFEVEAVTEKGDDTVIDFDVLPNRAHDCLCHRGIARELGVIFELPLEEAPIPAVATQKELNDMFSVRVEEPNLCPRYIGRLVTGIKIGASPAWLVKKIEAIGQRSINNVVDATNYMLFNYGQPIHAFDAAKVEKKEIVVRRAKKGETMTTLDNKKLELDETMLVIADAVEPMAMAGIKGGKKAEVDARTTDIIIEVANFEGVQVRKTSRTIGVMTDASKRYEHEISPELAGEVMERVTDLIMKVAGGKDTKVSDVQDVYLAKQPERVISVSLEKMNKVLGTTLATQDVRVILERFSFAFSEKDGIFSVTIPPERMDMRIQEDVIEEVGRIYGYINLQGTLPDVKGFTAGVNKEFNYQNIIRGILTDAGLSEVMTYTFGEEGEMELENPLSSDKPKLRSSLVPGIAKALELNIRNIDVLGIDDVRIFEIGHVFEKGKKEHTALSVGVRVPTSKKSGVKEKQVIDQCLSELSASLGTNVSGKESVLQGGGAVIEIDITALLGELSDPTTHDELLHKPASGKKYKPFSAYPFVSRDIAVWVPDHTAGPKLEKILIAEAGDLLVREPRLFDVFTKKAEDGTERTSLAYKLVFQAYDRTLTDVEVNTIMDDISVKIAEQKGWEVR